MPTLVRDRESSPEKPVDKKRRRSRKDRPGKSRKAAKAARSEKPGKLSRRERRAEKQLALAAEIEQADTTGSGAFYIDDTGRRRIDPRIRARREAVLYGHRRRRLRRVFLLMAVITLGTAGYFTVHSSVVSARSIDITGGPHTSVEEIRAAAAIRTDDQMLDIDEAAIAKRVEALPWVDKATVARKWPRTVSISITERKPRAFLQDGAGWLVVDETGRVLGPTPDVLNVFVTHITGVAPAPVGHTVDARIRGALAAAGKLTPSLSGRTQSLSVSPDGNVDLKLLPRGTVNLGRAEDAIDAKVRALQTMLAQADLRDLCKLDLRAPNSPVLTRDPSCL